MNLDELGFGPLSEKKERRALKPSELIPLDTLDIDYPAPPANTSPGTKAELKLLKFITENFELTKENETKLDKNFVKAFISYAKENDLSFDKSYIKNLINDSGSLILRLKKAYDRPRPFQLAPIHNIEISHNKEVQGELGTASTPSYPSGHTTQAYMIAGILSQENPDHHDKLMEMADAVAFSRLQLGVHFPSDNEFGKILALNYILPSLEKKVYLNTSKKSLNKMSASKPYKYTAKFSEEILATSKIESGEWQMSHASLEKLRPLIPTEIDFEKNIDLIGVAFNAAVANRFNKNDDGIDTQTALAIKNYFVNKPTNIEHQKQKVVGHIVSSAFSKFGTNEILEDQVVKDLRGPFNIACAAVIYRTVNPQFADLLEDTGAGFDKKISASWEIGFNEYNIALGSENIDEAEIISDPERVEEFSQYLKANEGAGETDDGTKVYRLVVGDIYPLGIGFTANPAAEVEGLVIRSDPQEEVEEEISLALNYCPDCIEVGDKFIKNLKTEENKISQSSETDVNYIHTNTIKTVMETNILEKLERVLKEHADAKEFSKEAVANIGEVVHDAIREQNEQYVAEKEKSANAERELAESQENFKKSVAELEEKLSSAEEKISELDAENKERDAREAFNLRMGVIDEEYQLEEDDRKILASELSSLDITEEAFAEYQEKLAVLWNHKNKEVIEAQEQEFNAKIEAEVEKRISEIGVASTQSAEESDVTVEDAMENMEEENSPVPSNSEASAEEEVTLEDRFAKAFSKENFIIS